MSVSQSGAVVFNHVNLVLPDRVIERGALKVEAGRIVQISESPITANGADEIDGRGLYLAPGFIDIHCHGDGAESFFPDGNAAAATLLRNGTTGVLATLAYSQMEPGRLACQIEEFWGSLDARSRQTVLGLHLEGPYTSPKYGANLSKAGICIYPPDPAQYGPILEHLSHLVRFWTFAPEHEGAEAFADAASRKGVVLAAGHTEAGVDCLQRFLSRGLRVATHWTNASGAPATRYLGTREPGIDEFALRHDSMFAEVIPDREGRHVRPFMCELLYRVKGADGILLITDSTFTYVEGNEGSDVNLSVDGQLSGSRLTMPDAARNFRRFTGCSLPEIFRMGALNPARLFGWDREIGSLEPGKRANLILTDEAMALHGVWLDGERVA